MRLGKMWFEVLCLVGAEKVVSFGQEDLRMGASIAKG